MKALSIKQPWAWLIVNGYKPFENRSWQTKFRGEFGVHASLQLDNEGYKWVEENSKKLGVDMSEFPLPYEFVRGAIIGKATITDCVTASDSPWFFGPVGFVLEKAESFEKPIPCKGKLGFFETSQKLDW